MTFNAAEALPEPLQEALPKPLHVILISTADAPACLEAARSLVKRSSATLHSLSFKPVGMGFEAVVKFAGASDRAASRLADRLAALPEVGSVRLEHHLLRA